MKCAPFPLTDDRKWEESLSNANYGTNEDDGKTQDGTIDLYGRPALKHKTGAWKAAMFCLVQQMLSTVAIQGVGANLVAYMTTVMHQSNEAAAKNVTNWSGTIYVTPLLIAFLADSYTGRFLGAVIASAITITGFVMLTFAGTLHTFRPPQCQTKNLECEKPNMGQSAFLFAGLYVVALGFRGIARTVATIGADQFDEKDKAEAKQKSSFFTANFVAAILGSFFALTFFVYLQNNVNVGLAWGLSTMVLVMGTVVFVFGRNRFRYHSRPRVNPLTRIAQVLVAFVRKINLKVLNPDDLYEVQDSELDIKGSSKIQHSGQCRFLDKAALLTEKDKSNGGQVLLNPWHTCTVTQVEEVKFLFSSFPLFLTCILFGTCWSQVLTLFIQQGYSMDCKLGSFTIPAASVDIFECLSVFFCAFFYDQLLVPFLRRFTGNPRGMTILQRIGFGLFLSTCAMVIAAVVEKRRIHTAQVHGLLDNPHMPIPMSIFYLVPQFFVVGAAEVFTFVGLQEFFYDQAPNALRCLSTSFGLMTIALGYFVGTFLLTIVGHITKQNGKPGWIADNLNRSRLDLFYFLLAGLSAISLLLFVLFATLYKYKVVAKGPIKPLTLEIQETAHVPKQMETFAETPSPSTRPANLIYLQPMI